jgi:glycerol kinase
MPNEPIQNMKPRGNQRAVLVVDQGSHASKALIYSDDGELLADTESAVETFHPEPGWVEHDAEALLASVPTAVTHAIAEANLAPNVIRRAGLATQRSTVVAWDAVTGRALSPALSWRDTRYAAWLARLNIDRQKVRRITGLVPSPHYGASKLRWCLDQLPDVTKALGQGRLRMGPLSSFLTTRLASSRHSGVGSADHQRFGSPVVDPANASRTLLWDIASRSWSKPMLAAFGIPPEILPRPVPSRHDYGVLDTSGAPIPMTLCTGDQSAALFAAGPPDRDTVYVNLGTGAFLQRAGLNTQMPPGLLKSICWQEGDRVLEVLEGTVNGAGAALSWLATEVNTPEQALIEAAPGWLDTVTDPPLFANGVGGLGSPYWLAEAPVRFDRKASIPERTVAVLESVVFLIQTNLRVMDKPPAARIAVSGGLARLDGLCQRLADLAGIPVLRRQDVESTARGVAWLLSAAPGDAFAHNGMPAVTSPPGVASAALFEPRSESGLAARFARWQAYMAQLTGREGNPE